MDTDQILSSSDEEETPKADSIQGSRADEKNHGNSSRYDIVLWLFGLLFIVILHSAIFGIGSARGWDAPSAYNYNYTNTTIERFLPKPFIVEPGVYKRGDANAAGRWYFWKLKPALVTAGTKIFVWTCYITHNLLVWMLLYLQHKSKSLEAYRGSQKYSSKPDKYNMMLFTVNVFYHILHLISTHTTYDGLAADTSEASSQSSVLVVLILIATMEFQERGIFFGYPNKTQQKKYLKSVFMSPVNLIRKYHGYFIYWAAIYTFWYHPMENTLGHAFGFTHTWMFMLQGSLAFQTMHLNKYWRLIMECWIIIHSGIVAYQTFPNVMGQEVWPTFVFGLGTVFAFTQVYGLPMWKSLPPWSRAMPVGVYLVILLAVYSYLKDSSGRPYTRLTGIFQTPAFYYISVVLGWLVITFITKLIKKSRKDTFAKGVTSIWLTLLKLFVFVFIYAVTVFLSWLFEYLDIPVNLVVLSIAYSLIFLVLPAIGGSFVLKSLL